MARLNIEDEHWDRIEALARKAKCDIEKAAGNVLLFFRLAQQRYRHDLLIDKSDFEAYGLMPELIGIFAVEKERDRYQQYDAFEQYEWIKQRRKAGQKGGKSKSKNKAKTLKRGNAAPPYVFNDLSPKQTRSKIEANPKPLHSPLSTLLSAPSNFLKSDKQNSSTNENDRPAPPAVSSSSNFLSHWLVDLWNEHCGNLKKVLVLGPKRLARIEELVAKNPSREDWCDAIKKIAASDFCTGRVKEAPFNATFNFLLDDEVFDKAREGIYDNKKIEPRPTAGAKTKPEINYELSKEERERALAISRDMSWRKGSQKKRVDERENR